MPECREANPESDSRPWRGCVRNENHPGWHRDGLGFQWPPTVKPDPLSTPAGIMSEEQFTRMLAALDLSATVSTAYPWPSLRLREQLDAMADELRKAKHEIKILKESEVAEVGIAHWERDQVLKANATLVARIEKLERKIRKLKRER